MRRNALQVMIVGLLLVVFSACSGISCPSPSGPSKPLPLGTFEGLDRDTETRLIISDNSTNLSGEAFTRIDDEWQELGLIGGLNTDEGPLITVQPDGPVFDGIYNEGVFRGNTLSRKRECLGTFQFKLLE